MTSTPLTLLFAAFSTQFRDGLEKQMAAVGLHAGQVFVLFSLWQTDGQSQAELVRKLNVSAPTINNFATRLAAMEYVEMRRDGVDARVMRVFLTGKGREIKPIVENQWAKFEEQTFGVLTETERMMTSLLLEKLISNMRVQK